MERVERQHAGTGPRVPTRLGDVLYLVGHDVDSGRPRVDAAAMSLGLSAAVLLELVGTQHVVVAGETLFPIRWHPPSDPLGHTVWERLAIAHSRPEGPGSVADWVRFLALDAVEDVRTRLVAEGWLIPSRARRRLGGSRTAYVGRRGTTAAAWPPIGLAKALDRGLDALTPDEALLASLASITGLVDAVPVLRWDCAGRHHARAAYERLQRLGEENAPAWIAPTRIADGTATGRPGRVNDRADGPAAPVLWQVAQVLRHTETAVGVGILAHR